MHIKLELIEHIACALQYACHVRPWAWLFARVYNHNNASRQDEYKDGDQIEDRDQDEDENNVLLEVTLELSSPAVLHVYKCT